MFTRCCGHHNSQHVVVNVSFFFFLQVFMAANVHTQSDFTPSQLEVYVVSTRNQSLQAFVEAEGDKYYSPAYPQHTLDRVLESKTIAWKQANHGKDSFKIGDKIYIPGRTAARDQWLANLRTQLQTTLNSQS